MSDERLPLPNFTVDAVDDEAPTERAPAVGPAPVPARMRGMALTLLWWRDDEREIAESARAD
jgi:hypothetical protein